MWTILSTPLLAGVIAICFRFPIPFAGYSNGIRAFIPAMLAAVIYGLMGGFLFQAVIGSIGGAFAALISFDFNNELVGCP